jgi:hypothetical protein
MNGLTITAVWLRRRGDDVEALLEIDGEWRLAIREHFDGAFSHIAEDTGADKWPIDYKHPVKRVTK